MDAIDKKILMALQKNAKQNTKEIAQMIGLTVTPTYERIKKLEQQGVIRKYVALLNREKIDKQIIAYCQISLYKHQKQFIVHIKDRILAFKAVMECHHVSGHFDFLLKIAVKDMNDFHNFISNELAEVDGISNIQSSFIINSVKESTIYELD